MFNDNVVKLLEDFRNISTKISRKTQYLNSLNTDNYRLVERHAINIDQGEENSRTGMHFCLYGTYIIPTLQR